MIYVAAILGGMCVGSSGPLFLEITCEISYPISEGISAGFLAFILNLSAAVYLLITLIPSLGEFNYLLIYSLSKEKILY